MFAGSAETGLTSIHVWKGHGPRRAPPAHGRRWSSPPAAPGACRTATSSTRASPSGMPAISERAALGVVELKAQLRDDARGDRGHRQVYGFAVKATEDGALLNRAPDGETRLCRCPVSTWESRRMPVTAVVTG